MYSCIPFFLSHLSSTHLHKAGCNTASAAEKSFKTCVDPEVSNKLQLIIQTPFISSFSSFKLKMGFQSSLNKISSSVSLKSKVEWNRKEIGALWKVNQQPQISFKENLGEGVRPCQKGSVSDMLLGLEASLKASARGSSEGVDFFF